MCVPTRRVVCHVRELCCVTVHLCRRSGPHTHAHMLHAHAAQVADASWASSLTAWPQVASGCGHHLSVRCRSVVCTLWPASGRSMWQICYVMLCYVASIGALHVADMLCYVMLCGQHRGAPFFCSMWQRSRGAQGASAQLNPSSDSTGCNRGVFVRPSLVGPSLDDKCRDAAREEPRVESWMVASCGRVSITSKALMKAE